MRKKTQVIIMAIIILLGTSIYFLFPLWKTNMENDMEEFDNKYRPQCERLGGLYLEEGYSHTNKCFLNKSGVLYETRIVKLNGEWYLQGDCYMLNDASLGES